MSSAQSLFVLSAPQCVSPTLSVLSIRQPRVRELRKSDADIERGVVQEENKLC